VSETLADKSARYLAEARLTVLEVREGAVRASCRGAGHVYSVGWTRGGGWRCSCPARGLCAHLAALQAVVVVEGNGR
jgi:hypothetical protein